MKWYSHCRIALTATDHEYTWGEWSYSSDCISQKRGIHPLPKQGENVITVIKSRPFLLHVQCTHKKEPRSKNFQIKAAFHHSVYKYIVSLISQLRWYPHCRIALTATDHEYTWGEWSYSVDCISQKRGIQPLSKQGENVITVKRIVLLVTTINVPMNHYLNPSPNHYPSPNQSLNHY